MRLGLLVSMVASVAAVAGCQQEEVEASGDDDDALSSEADRGEHFRARVRRTSQGVPHVKATDLGGAGYGYGYVFAEDNLCNFEEEVLTIRGQRAKYFGDRPYDLGNTRSRSNVASDAVYRMLATEDVVTKSRAALTPEMRALVRGYAAGISRYVRELKRGRHAGRHASCRNEAWVREVDESDIYLRFYKLALLGSSTNFIDAIAAARPATAPGGALPSPAPAPPSSPSASEITDGLAGVAPTFMAARRGEVGSNMYAFGKEATGGGGIQFGNPHFPWYGGERLYQVHLTVPGKMDVQGVSIYGIPVVLIGFTEHFAWSHTTSTAYRFTPYSLTLKSGDPLTYIQDGAEKKITPQDFAIEVKGDDGALRTESIRLYKSEYGPMLYLGNPLFAWTAERAFTMRDANADNFRLIRQYVRWNMAKSLDEFEKIQAEEVATPWVNTTAADKDGRTYYADISVVPNVPDDLAASCVVTPYSQALAQASPGLPLLDGSKKACDWKIDPRSPQRGTLPAAALPKVERDDWVLNCNDSYWLTNAKAPITGFPQIVGREAYPQSLRSRLCHEQITDRLDGTDGLDGTRMTTAALKQIVLGSRVYSAERFKKPVLDAVCATSTIQLTGDPIDGSAVSPPVAIATAPACAALRAWDDHNHASSRGSIVWDELWFRVEKLLAAGGLSFKVPFNAADPLHTPRDLDTAAPGLAQAFAAAIRSVQQAGFALDAPRSAIAYRLGKGGASDRIPVPGGFQITGNFTIAQVNDPKLAAGTGYGPTTFGNSYMQVVGYSPRGVDASTFVTYGLSTDPASPHYDDYTRLYSEKRWLKAAFTEREIARETKSTLVLEQ